MSRGVLTKLIIPKYRKKSTKNVNIRLKSGEIIVCIEKICKKLLTNKGHCDKIRIPPPFLTPRKSAEKFLKNFKKPIDKG